MFNPFKKKHLVSEDRLDQFGHTVTIYKNIPSTSGGLFLAIWRELGPCVWDHPYYFPIMKTEEVQKEVKWFVDKWFSGFDEKVEGIDLKREVYFNRDNSQIQEIRNDLSKVLFKIILVKIDLTMREGA